MYFHKVKYFHKIFPSANRILCKSLRFPRLLHLFSQKSEKKRVLLEVLKLISHLRFCQKCTDLVAGAVVGSDGVATHVLAAPVVGRALVLVREEDRREPVLLDRVVREELQAETVALRCDHLPMSRW